MDFLALKTDKVVYVAGCKTVYNFLKIYKEVLSLDSLPTPTLPYNFAAALGAINQEDGRDNNIPAAAPTANDGAPVTAGGYTAPPGAAATPTQAGTVVVYTHNTGVGGPPPGFSPALPPAPTTPMATPGPTTAPAAPNPNGGPAWATPSPFSNAAELLRAAGINPATGRGVQASGAPS